MMKQVFAVVALSVVLTSCGATEVEPDASNTETTASEQGSTDGGQAAMETRDLSEGGTCSAGEEIVIGVDKSSPVIEGDCGVVTVLASGVTGNIALAEQVVVLGEGSSLLGESWKEAVAEGAKSTMNVDEMGAVTVVGDESHVTTKTAGTIIVTGDDITVNANDISSLISTGNGAKVVVSGEITALEVLGDKGTYNWSNGVEKPDTDEGSNNTFVR